MKKRLVVVLALVFLGAPLAAYSFELAAGEGSSAGWGWGLASDTRTGNSPGGSFMVQLGFPLEVGKLHMTAQGDLGPESGLLGGIGWGGEWFALPWLSFEAAAVVKAGWFLTWFSREPTQFVYGGVEPLFRANLLLLDGFLVLGVTSSPSVRWLQQTLVVAHVPAVVTVGLRF